MQKIKTAILVGSRLALCNIYNASCRTHDDEEYTRAEYTTITHLLTRRKGLYLDRVFDCNTRAHLSRCIADAESKFWKSHHDVWYDIRLNYVR